MPLSQHDDVSLPSRRALREAERTAVAGRGARSRRGRPAVARCPAPAGPPARVPSLVPAVAAPAPADMTSVRPVVEHLLEGGDDTWVPDVAPRPTPIASRVPVGAGVVPTPQDRRAWRRLPQLIVIGALVAASGGYVWTGDPSATAGEVLTYERAEQTVAAEAATLGALAEAGTSGMVAGEDGLLRVPADEASRADRPAVLPGCDGVPPETPQDNGRIDEAVLCPLWDGTTSVRADAAMSLALLNEQYRARFGVDICLTDGYRSFSEQVAVRTRKPGLAAEPGTSEHGFGLAVDLCGGVESQGEGYWWLRENAAAFGYENPRWAQRGGGGPVEPWHWEYAAGQW